ncbi:blastula protease 10 [Nephila pilipes]|uniref:Metalloendopeptidase n=1 Tax=Nephila pilipes TaxID=299642 RepID=A0A8X6MQZ4_NEPPI|nr:blastula protease 10 [Nephila pilipes]
MKALHNEHGDMRFSPEYRHGAEIKDEKYRWRNNETGKVEIPYYIHSSIRKCYSYIGRVGRAQKLSLGNGCEYVGTIVHEFGHALGLHHEHQRSDRDTYRNVYEKNVTKDQEQNFNKTLPSQELIFTSYDYASIMHYSNYAFSRSPGTLKTMEAKNGTPLDEPYDKPGLTNSDITMVKELYKC